MPFDLTQKGLDVKAIAQEAIKDRVLLDELLEKLLAKNDTLRFNCFEGLLLIAQTEPQILYPHWDFFAELLESPNNYHRYMGVYLIANLTCVDQNNYFSKLLPRYFELLGHKSVMVAGHIAANAKTIIHFKPELEPDITRRLLRIDATKHPESRKELIKSYIIETFDACWELSSLKPEIYDFVQSQTASSSPKTRKIVAAFLAKRTLNVE